MKIHWIIFAYVQTILRISKRTFSSSAILLQLEMVGESLMENVAQWGLTEKDKTAKIFVFITFNIVTMI